MTDKTPAVSSGADATAPAAPVEAALAEAALAEAVPGPVPPVSGARGPEQKPGEIGGPSGPEPTRYGDWQFKGRCSDF